MIPMMKRQFHPKLTHQHPADNDITGNLSRDETIYLSIVILHLCCNDPDPFMVFIKFHSLCPHWYRPLGCPQSSIFVWAQGERTWLRHHCFQAIIYIEQIMNTKRSIEMWSCEPKSNVRCSTWQQTKRHYPINGFDWWKNTLSSFSSKPLRLPHPI